MELSELPHELIQEILGRASFKNMLISKGVCKHWRALISDPTFLQFRRQLRSQSFSNKQSPNSIKLLVCSSDCLDMYDHPLAKTQLYISTSDSINNSATLEDNSVRTLKLTHQHKRQVMELMDGISVISSSFLELVLLYLAVDDHVYLYNPSIEEFLSLPKNPDWDKCELLSMGLGRVDSTNEYKVMRVFKSRRSCQCEVFTLGFDDHWRTAAAPPYVVSDNPGAFVAGGVYMLFDEFECENCIARFDIEREQWTVIALPEGYFGKRRDLFIREVGGLFCLTYNGALSANVWVLKNHKQGVWVLEYSIRFSYFSNFYDAENEYPYFYPLSLDYGNGKVLLVRVEDNGGTKLISFDPKTHNVEEIPIPHPTIDFTATLFTENFHSIF